MHTRRQRRIVITGFMCAGKTTVARALAARLNCAALDTDAAIVERTGRQIAAIIGEDGEARFRQIETDVLRDSLERADARIIALGGGAWTLAGNRALIATHDCLTVWLDAPFDLCWQRIANAAAQDEAARPLARTHAQSLALYTARRQAYSLAALHLPVNEARSPEDTAAEIASIIEREDFAQEQQQQQ
ncbi:MAG TPA: shikimate kinase [Pyrinomonadaceae bacterium]|nr:shikimate kinase [Pyrinomonadaceae bacterium]